MLERLRAKPHHIKQRVALAITVVVFSTIVFVWWSSRDARSREIEVQSKAVSPLAGVTSMFDGFFSDFGKTSSSTVSKQATASSTDDFDFGSVVVIDQSATSSRSTSSPKTLRNTGAK